MLYKAQIRSTIEYASLSWGGAANKHLSLLDKMQRRASRIIRGNTQTEVTLDSLQHRRDVSGMCVMYRVHQQTVSHLQPLRLPGRQQQRTTRSVEQAPAALEEPRSYTTHHQRQFLQRYCKMWNLYLRVNNPNEQTINTFKKSVNNWLRQ